jgi:hypothetical protein
MNGPDKRQQAIRESGSLTTDPIPASHGVPSPHPHFHDGGAAAGGCVPDPDLFGTHEQSHDYHVLVSVIASVITSDCAYQP